MVPQLEDRLLLLDVEDVVAGMEALPVSAVKRSIGSTTGCTITEKAPTRAFSWLKAPTTCSPYTQWLYYI